MIYCYVVWFKTDKILIAWKGIRYISLDPKTMIKDNVILGSIHCVTDITFLTMNSSAAFIPVKASVLFFICGMMDILIE